MILAVRRRQFIRQIKKNFRLMDKIEKKTDYRFEIGRMNLISTYFRESAYEFAFDYYRLSCDPYAFITGSLHSP